jgi:hypothetical protein
LLKEWVNHNYGLFLERPEEAFWQWYNSTPAEVIAETKQHLLCNGKTLKDAIDLSGIITLAFAPPSFTYSVRPGKSAYILVVQRSYPDNMGLSWEAVQSAMLPFIASLPSGNQLAIVTYDQEEAELNLPITELNEDNRPMLHAALPRRPVPNQHLSMEACHGCGLDVANGLSFEDDTQVYTVMLVRSGQLNSSSRHPPPRNLLTIGLDRTLDVSWSNVSKEMFVLGQCVDQQECQAAIVSNLMQVLRATSGEDVQHLLHRQVKASSQGSFMLPERPKHLVLMATARDERDIASLELTSPSGEVLKYPFYSHNMAYLHLVQEEAVAGLWTYQVRMYSEDDSCTVDAYTQQDTSSSAAGLLQAWATAEVDRQGHPRVRLFAQLGASETSDELTAVVSRPGHRGQDLPLVEVALLDTGSGYPDIRKSDGIFSAYFTELSPAEGYYSVNVVAKTPSGSFQTSTAFYVAQMPSSFYVRREEGSRLLVSDVFPPNRITDLNVVGQLGESQLFVTLNWTAPGGDYDHGSAFRYEVRCATSIASLQEETYRDQSIPVHASLIPEPEAVGTIQRCTVGVPWHNQVFYYGIVAIDASGNRGQISNSVPVMVTKQEDAIAIETTTISNEVIVKAQPRSTSTGVATYVWAPIMGAIVVVLLVCSAVVIRRSCSLVTEYKCDPSEDKNSSFGSTETSSAGVSCDSSSLADGLPYHTDMSFDQKIDMWSGPSLEPRIHVMEDYSVYRDLSTMSEVPSEYCRLDQMLSALLKTNPPLYPRDDDGTLRRSESLV